MIQYLPKEMDIGVNVWLPCFYLLTIKQKSIRLIHRHKH